MPMFRSIPLLFGLFFSLLLTSCIDEEEFQDSPTANFEALWKIVDEQYCFLDYKGIDWDSVHTVYSAKINDKMDRYALFDTLSNMLSTLKDGHVNLYSTHDMARYWSWYEDYPTNFYEDLQRTYLGTDYRIASGLKYTILRTDSIGYLYCGSFSDGFSDDNVSEALYYMRNCRGLILDVRSNSGGVLTYATRLAEHFTLETVPVGYIQHKTGKGHSDFSEPYAVNLDPSTGIHWLRPVVLLTNRKCFSATNWFVNCMQQLPQVITVGDRTGGGSGLPFSSELPNGWYVRFSASPMLNPKKEQLEFGIDPNVRVDIPIPEAFATKRDAMIDYADSVLLKLTEE